MRSQVSCLLIDVMYVLYQETMAQLIRARQNMNLDIPILRGDLFSVGDTVLFKNHGKEKLSSQYNDTYRVLRKIGDKMVDIINNRGEVRRALFPQLKRVTPMEALITKILINVQYGRQAKYLKSALPEALRAVSGDLSEKTVAGKPKPTDIKSTKSGIPRKKTKRKTVNVARNTTQPWLHRLCLRNLKLK